jgi:hypothetical protein
MWKNRFAAIIIVLAGAAIAKAQLLLHTFDYDPVWFGWSVADAGDVNNDGFGDIIVGGQTHCAKVFSGHDGAELYFFDDANPYWYFGWSVSGAGDVNNDGFADVIVGAADWGGSTAGGAFVYSGRTGARLYSYTGVSGDGFAISVAGGGDVNNDGYPDFAIGAPYDGTNGTWAGKAAVYSGKTGAILYTYYGDGPSTFLGTSLSGAGDVNKDGYDDIIVGEPGFSTGMSEGRHHRDVARRLFAGLPANRLWWRHPRGAIDCRAAIAARRRRVDPGDHSLRSHPRRLRRVSADPRDRSGCEQGSLFFTRLADDSRWTVI